jgi:hypothetical protein
MTKQTRALQMAINALTNCSGFEKAIQACKEALEPTVAELNDEYLRDTHVEGLNKPTSHTCRSDDVCKCEQSSLVQEPVGYVDEFGNFEFAMQMWMEEEPNVTWTPVYTTPSREWQSLSDEEIEELYGDCSIEYFRDIEAKLREKNNG